METYTYDECRRASLDYFNGDELAAEVFAGKYALRDASSRLYEQTPTDMHRRLAREFARIENNYPNPLSEDDIFSLLSSWRVVPQGSPMAAIGNDFQYQSLSNCFVIDSPHDSYGGILKADQEQAQIMKRRGGVGFDVSLIRPRGRHTSNAALTTDGIGIFMERFSNTCREVAQGGRRGALMLTISVHHPEIRTFINIKRDRKKVTGANISIRLTDEFMEAVKDNKPVQLRFPVEPNVEHSIEELVDARALWHEIIEAAWESAEPGLLFWDNVLKMTPTTCYPEFKSISTNPCIIGSTMIATADGRNAVSIKQLAEEGKDIPVYSTNPKTGQIEIKWGRNPRLTKQQVEVWKLILDDGSELVATPDHNVMLRDCSYVELRSLKVGDSLFPFSSFDSNGYRQICETGVKMSGGARRNRRQYRLINEFLRGPVDPKLYAIHHVDFDSTNDEINNLVVITHEEHRNLHARLMIGDLNPYHRMSDEWKATFAKHPGESNGRYSGFKNSELLAEGRKLFEQNGRITTDMWIKHAKQHGLPQFLSNEFRFGSWKNFVNQVATNHKVVSIECIGVDDVFNITVDDNHNYHVITSHEDDRYVVSSGFCVKNCGEIVLSAYDSCRLLLVNLCKFVRDPFTPMARFDANGFGIVVQKAQRLMDDLVDLELEVIDKIINKIINDPEPADVKRTELELWEKIKKAASQGRRTGLGITGLGDALAFMNIRYGSDESVTKTEEIYRCLALNAYRSTVTMAQERGAFPAFSHALEKDHPFIERIMTEDTDLKKSYKKHGRRNIALTTTAPAGSVSILTQSTSGCEPAFLLSYKRRRKISSSDVAAKVDFIDDMGDRWQEYVVYHPGFKLWMEVTGKSDVEQSPYWQATSNDVDWVKKIDVQAAAQRWICHSISNTTNVPADTTVDIIKQIYVRGWETGCKGVTVYREGSRSGVLVKNEEPKKSDSIQPASIIEVHAPKRPSVLECDIHRVTVKGDAYLVLVGLYDNKPYEVFAGLSEHVEVPKKIKRGSLIKNGKKDGLATYNLRIPLADDDELLFKDIVTMFDSPLYGAFTRTISLSLRHGIPVKFLCEQLKKDRHSDMTSFSSVIARVLGKNYIPDGTKPTDEKLCPTCSSEQLSYQQGCVSCVSCGWSRCS